MSAIQGTQFDLSGFIEFIERIEVAYIVRNDNNVEERLDEFVVLPNDPRIVNNILYLAPLQTCTVRLVFFGSAFPVEGLVHDTVVRVQENFIFVKPKAIQSDSRFIDARKLTDGTWQLIGFAGFKCDFEIERSSVTTNEGTITFRTEQPVGGLSQHHPLPTVSDPGNYDITSDRRDFTVSNPDELSWIFPYGHDYWVFFTAQRTPNTTPFTQGFRVFSVDPDNARETIADLHYATSLSTDGTLTIDFNPNADCIVCDRKGVTPATHETKGISITVEWGDGGRTGPLSLIDTTNNERLTIEPLNHTYTSPEPQLVTIILESFTRSTKIIESFFVKNFSFIYTVRIDESRTYDAKDTSKDDMGGDGLDYIDTSSPLMNRGEPFINQARTPPVTIITVNQEGEEDVKYFNDANTWANIYPFDSIDPVLMNGTTITNWLDHANWGQDENGTALETAAEHNIMIELPPFWYKIERGTPRQNNNPKIIDISICSSKPDDTWTSVHPNAQTCIYLAAFLKNIDEGDEFKDQVSLRQSMFRLFKDIPEDRPAGSAYELMTHRVWTAIQVLFLMRYRTLNSSSLFKGYNPNDAAQLNLANSSSQSGLTGTGDNARFFGLDNIWGLRPTRLAGIKYENGAFVVDTPEGEKSYPIAENQHINRPIITNVVGDNDGGFLPTAFEGYPGERYQDAVKINGEEDVFAGVPTYLHTDQGVDYNDNGIFAIGNRTLNPNYDPNDPASHKYTEYFTERYMVKESRLSEVNSQYVKIGKYKQTPLNAVFIDKTSWNRKLTISLEEDRAYRYIIWDSLMGAEPAQRKNPKVQTKFERTYVEQQPNLESPIDILVYAIDKLWNVEHTYDSSVWVLSLNNVVNIGPTSCTLDDPVIVDATRLQEYVTQSGTYGPFAESVIVEWGTYRANPDGSKNTSRPIKETRKLGESWKFEHYYRHDGDHNWEGSTGQFVIKITVNGGGYNEDGTPSNSPVYSNGGVIEQSIWLSGLQSWYNFRSIAGYVDTVQDNGQIQNHGFELVAQFEGSAGEYLEFFSDHEIRLDTTTKHDWFLLVLSAGFLDKICGFLKIGLTSENR